jgi:hypothetical protein
MVSIENLLPPCAAGAPTPWYHRLGPAAEDNVERRQCAREQSDHVATLASEDLMLEHRNERLTVRAICAEMI